MVPLFQRISLSPSPCQCRMRTNSMITTLRNTQHSNTTTVCVTANDNQYPAKTGTTYGSLDLGIRVPSSFMRSLMLNLRLLSTEHKQDKQAEREDNDTSLLPLNKHYLVYMTNKIKQVVLEFKLHKRVVRML